MPTAKDVALRWTQREREMLSGDHWFIICKMGSQKEAAKVEVTIPLAVFLRNFPILFALAGADNGQILACFSCKNGIINKLTISKRNGATRRIGPQLNLSSNDVGYQLDELDANELRCAMFVNKHHIKLATSICIPKLLAIEPIYCLWRRQANTRLEGQKDPPIWLANHPTGHPDNQTTRRLFERNRNTTMIYCAIRPIN